MPAGNEWVDWTLQGVSKNTSIEFIQNYYGIAPEETCTFGDNLNDIEMLNSITKILYPTIAKNIRQQPAA